MPAIDLRGGRVVRLVRGRPEAETRYSDDPPATAAAFLAEGAVWLHVVDLDAAFGDGDNRPVLRRILSHGGPRVQVGGGIRSQDVVDALVEEGAARVVLGTAAIRDPAFLRAAVDRHGERIVVALDVEGTTVRVGGWTEDAGGIDDVLRTLVEAGARRFLVTQVERDGTMEGPDLALYRRLMEAGRPLIASGGVRDAADLHALDEVGVEAAVVGRALYEGTLSLAEALAVSS
jgi:phosphoribosylanthranilate isomerase